MTVRAKFYVSSVEPNDDKATAHQVQMHPVCRGVENAIWSQATPSGSLTMNVLNTAAFEQFEWGAEYEVTFTKVAKPSPNDGHPVKPTTDKRGCYVCETCGMVLGSYTEEAIEAQPYLAQYSTEETKAKALENHEQAFGAQ